MHENKSYHGEIIDRSDSINPNFSSTSDEVLYSKINYLLSELKKISPERYAEVIKKVSVSKASISEILDAIQNAFYSVLSDNKESHNKVINSYQKVIDNLQEMLNDSNITIEDKIKINQLIYEAANEINIKDRENKIFLDKIFKKGAVVFGIASIVAIKLIKKNSNNHIKINKPL